MNETIDGPRPPLGLPPGSVRAILSILIAGQFWLLLSLPAEHRILVPLNLYFLLSLVMVFFISHGRTIAGPGYASSPLYLPRGTIRLFLLAGTAAVVAIQYKHDPDQLWQRLTPAPAQLAYFPQFLFATFVGFFVGIVLRKLPTARSPFAQTLQAYLSIIAAIGMFVEVVLQCFVFPQLDRDIDLPLWQSILTGVMAFYFSIRS